MSEDRAMRERRIYDAGLPRESYRRIFRHTYQCHERHFKAKLRSILKPHEEGRFLELGSYVWADWLEGNGIKPCALDCINISETELDKGRDLCSGAEIKPAFHLMDAHHLGFPEDTFDVVFGGDILHHLELQRALEEVHRVLKPGGAVIFREPLAANPVGALVRYLTPKQRTPDEQPFRPKELRLFRSYFNMTPVYEQFFSVPLGVLSGVVFSNPENLLMRGAYYLDQGIVRVLPWVGLIYRYVGLIGTKKE